MELGAAFGGRHFPTVRHAPDAPALLEPGRSAGEAVGKGLGGHGLGSLRGIGAVVAVFAEPLQMHPDFLGEGFRLKAVRLTQ